MKDYRMKKMTNANVIIIVIIIGDILVEDGRMDFVGSQTTTTKTGGPLIRPTSVCVQH